MTYAKIRKISFWFFSQYLDVRVKPMPPPVSAYLNYVGKHINCNINKNVVT